MRKKNDKMEYQLIRSARKTLALEVRGGQVIVRAPQRLPRSQIDAFVGKHEKWIAGKLALCQENARRAEAADPLSGAEIKALAEKARAYIPGRVAYYAALIGVSYGRITIRCQRTKWGSCTAKGNLNFNCLLMLAPPEVLDCIVVHELCHRREMNHSERFYQEVYKFCPEYDRWHKWLRQNGSVIMSRVQ